jgi:hypothetical protein
VTAFYSKTPKAAVEEVVRVAADKAIISIGHAAMSGYVPLLGEASEHAGATSEPITGLAVKCTEDIIGYFRPHVGQIYFRSEPENPRTPIANRVRTIFEIVKPWVAGRQAKKSCPILVRPRPGRGAGPVHRPVLKRAVGCRPK